MMTQKDFEAGNEFYLPTNSTTIKLTCRKITTGIGKSKLSVFEEWFLGNDPYRSHTQIMEILEIKENGVLLNFPVFGYDSDFVKFEDCVLRDTLAELEKIRQKNQQR